MTTEDSQKQRAATPRSAWPSDDIDIYLMALARKAVESFPDKWPTFIQAAQRQTALMDARDAAELAPVWAQFSTLGPRDFATHLIADNELGRHLRRVAPFYAIVERSVQEQILRDAAVDGTHGASWAERWADLPPPGALPDALIESLLAALGPRGRDSFSQFVAASGNTKWLVAADFCLHDDTRLNDVFAYTLFAHDADFKERAAEITSVLPRDLKKTRDISQNMISYLRSGRRFNFAFIVNKDRALLKDVRQARDAIDQTLTMMRNYRDADKHADDIAAMKALRQEATANNFNSALLSDMILASAFCAFISVLLQMEGRAELIGWFPDRDKMTTAYQAIAYRTFASNASAFALRRKIPEAQIVLAFPGPREDGRKGMYYDEMVRIPDYVAGAVAATAFEGLQPSSLAPKHADIVGKAFRDNERFALFRVALPPQNLRANRILIQSMPPSST